MQTSECGLPVLQGFDFPPRLVDEHVQKGEVLYANFSTSAQCNLRCEPCYASAGAFIQKEIQDGKGNLLTFDQWSQVLEKLHPQIRTLVISGEGDATATPEMWAHNQYLIDKALGYGLQVVMFTNGATMDDEMAKWIAERNNLAIIGKWYDVDPTKNTGRMRPKKGVLYPYVCDEGIAIPGHLHVLADYGLAEQKRLAVESVIWQKNVGSVIPMWRTARTKGFIPIFSWLVPTGYGILAAKKDGLVSEDEKKRITQQCRAIDKNEFGIIWDETYGPHIGSSGCVDKVMLYVDTLGRVRSCPTTHTQIIGNILDGSLAEILQARSQKQKEWAAARSDAVGRPTCACALSSECQQSL